MFRLSNVGDRKLQKIISKEIAHGFDDLFDFSSHNNEIIVSKIQEFCKYFNISTNSEFERNFIILKLKGMYDEILDQDNEYTFDEHGEWLFSKILEYSYNLMFDKLKELYPKNEGYYMDEISKVYKTSLNKKELKYVDDFIKKYFQEYINDIRSEYEDESEFEECKYEIIGNDWPECKMRFTLFPFMYNEILHETNPEILFWDRDFEFIDDMGVKNFEELRTKSSELVYELGFTTVTENTEMITGSNKFSINEDE